MDFFVKGQHGADSPYSNVEYTAGVIWSEKRNKFVNMTYLIPGLGGLEMEEMAMDLADRVERDHPGQGQKAFESAKIQLLSRDYNGEWAELLQRIKLHKMWGGPVPAAVLLPDDEGKKWEMMVTDKNGMPHKYEISQKNVGAGEELPLPNRDTARKGRFGWDYKPTPQQAANNRQTRRMHRARVRSHA
jgi:hypothetical protein